MAAKERDKEGLWEKVKQTTKPLHANRAGESFDSLFGEKLDFVAPSPRTLATRTVQPFREEPLITINTAKPAPVLDEPTRRKISKGRMGIEARIDLHGMTQEQAYSRLLGFLEQAQIMGRRTILVITGKGVRGEGILRNAVPRWLNEPDFRRLVSGYHEAAIVHGGSGALYVRVRRNKFG